MERLEQERKIQELEELRREVNSNVQFCYACSLAVKVEILYCTCQNQH